MTVVSTDENLLGGADDEDRFWRWVDKNGPIAKNNPELGRCWVWLGALTTKGYAQFLIYVLVAGRSVRRRPAAHRWLYERTKGPIPTGKVLDHFACDNPPCVNPDHVRPVTSRENSLRSDSIPARHTAKTHCPQNHPYDEENTRWSQRRNGMTFRICRQCARKHSREGQRRLRARRKARR